MTSKHQNLALAALIGASAVMPIQASAESQNTKTLDFRAKTEYMGNFDNQNTLRETVAFASEGTYNGRTSVPGQFGDIGRVTLTQNLETGLDSTLFGLRAQPQKWLGVTNSFVPTSGILFGGTTETPKGDISSIASEFQWGSKPLSLSLRAENQSSPSELTHFGGTFKYEFGKVKLQTGYDQVLLKGTDFSQIYASASYMPTPSDITTLSFASQKLSDSSDNQRLRVVNSHFGPKESWGHRSFVEYSWNDKRDEKSFTAHTIIAPFGTSTFGLGAANLLGDNTMFNDSSFKVLRTPFAIVTEAVPHYDRVVGGGGLKGIGLNLDLNHSIVADNEKTTLAGQLAYIGKYKGNTMGQNEFGVYIGSRYSFEDKNCTSYIDAGATLRVGKNLEFRTGFAFPLKTQNQQKPSGVIEAGIKF